jgi:hypothetical protein
VIGGKMNDQGGAPLAVIVPSPATAEDTFAVLPQDSRAIVQVRAVRQIRLLP